MALTNPVRHLVAFISNLRGVDESASMHIPDESLAVSIVIRPLRLIPAAHDDASARCLSVVHTAHRLLLIAHGFLHACAALRGRMRHGGNLVEDDVSNSIIIMLFPGGFMHNQEKKLDPIFCLLSAKKWLEAMVSHSDRIFDLLNLFSKIRAARDQEDYDAVVALNRELDGLGAEEHAFLIATAKANRWICIARSGGLISSPLIRRYLSLIEQALMIRNMREHDDEYLVGKGDSQDKFVHRYNGAGGETVQMDATCSGGTIEKWLIGGRVDVRAIASKTPRIISLFDAALEELVAKHVGPQGAEPGSV